MRKMDISWFSKIFSRPEMKPCWDIISRSISQNRQGFFTIFLIILMNKTRLENLTDWVFAIILTLLVLELKIPEHVSHASLMEGLQNILPTFFAYILVCATLTTYWFWHHYLITIFAKHISRGLVMMNIIFLVLLSLLPFSANLLGQYLTDPIAICIYGSNILLIIGSIIWMRHIIYSHPETDLSDVSREDARYAKIRIFFPLFCTLIAMILAFIHPTSSFLFFIIPLFFSLIPWAIAWMDRCVICYIWKKT